MSDQVQPPPIPGAGPRAEYERRRAGRLRRDPDSIAPTSETAWLRGAQGEARYGTRLNEDALLVGGVAVLHALTLPGKKADIDHLVVGPAGVTVIDSKTWTGRVWVGRAVIGRGRHAKRAPIDGMQRQVNRVHAALARIGRDDVPVEAALCFVNDNAGLDGRRCKRVDGVLVGTQASVARHAMRPGRYSIADVGRLVEILSAAFVVSGGSCLPTQPRIRTNNSERTPRRMSTTSSNLTRRASLGVVRAALWICLAIAAMAVTYRIVMSFGDAVQHTLAPPTEREVLAHRPEFRRRAIERARGPVRGPRVTQSGTNVVLIYRRGARCRVTLMVNRALLASAIGHPTITSTGCRRR